MNRRKTYLDSEVLIAVARTSDEIATRAIEILDNPARQFASSSFVRIEVLTKATYFNQREEIEFYEAFFEGCTLWADNLAYIVDLAQILGCKYGLGALDALHVACAVSLEADEFITTEKPTKPLHRVTEIQVISIAR